MYHGKTSIDASTKRDTILDRKDKDYREDCQEVFSPMKEGVHPYLRWQKRNMKCEAVGGTTAVDGHAPYFNGHISLRIFQHGKEEVRPQEVATEKRRRNKG